MTELIKLQDALRKRLIAAAPYLIPHLANSFDEMSLVKLLTEMSISVKRANDLSLAWFLLVAMVGSFPTSEDVREFNGYLKSSSEKDLFLRALKGALIPALYGKNMLAKLEVVSDRVIMDVDFCATHGHTTGIQRVTRETARQWEKSQNPFFAAWAPRGQGFRAITPLEKKRVTQWSSKLSNETTNPHHVDASTLIVPWNCTVVIPEMPTEIVSQKLSSLAEHSNNRVVCIGYDFIPITNAESVPASLTDRFARYLTVVKFSDRVAGISESAANEFRGFNQMLPAQGLMGPHIESIPLAAESVSSVNKRRPKKSTPLVLSVGTLEPRKNQLSTLAAAERLWQQGFEFELVFVGHPIGAPSEPFLRAAHQMKSISHRPVHILSSATDSDLAKLYEAASFTMFISLHEGYGLPVVESLAHGCPVIATNYGSIAEIAKQGGGCILVNPRDTDEIANAMADLLRNDDVLLTLRLATSNRPSRSWEEYATDLWRFFTADMPGRRP